MKIRQYQPADKKQVISLMSEFGTYLEDIDPLSRTNFAPNGPVYFTNKLLREVKKNNGAIFVAEENGKLIGFIGGYLVKQSKQELMEAKKTTPGTIAEFFVTQDARSQGIGAKLLDVMEKYLKKQGCKLIRFDVFAPNKIARNFYAKHGYQDRAVIISKEI